MNKRFKRCQELLAVSLAAMSCVQIHTEGFSFRSIVDNIKKKFSGQIKKDEETPCVLKDMIELANSREKLFAEIKKGRLGWINNEEQEKTLMEALLDYSRLLKKVKNDGELDELIKACDGDLNTLKLLLLERGHKETLKSMYSKELSRLVPPHTKCELFAERIRNLIPKKTYAEVSVTKNLGVLQSDIKRMGEIEIHPMAKKWLEFLELPVSEGRLFYSQGIGWILENYFGYSHAPNQTDAETVIEICKIWDAILGGGTNICEAINKKLTSLPKKELYGLICNMRMIIEKDPCLAGLKTGFFESYGLKQKTKLWENNDLQENLQNLTAVICSLILKTPQTVLFQKVIRKSIDEIMKDELEPGKISSKYAEDILDSMIDIRIMMGGPNLHNQKTISLEN